MDSPLENGNGDLQGDPRHLDDSPMPWLRFFFPKDFDVREGAGVNPYYQYFDVCLEDLKPDLATLPPEWTPNSYFRLSFTQTNIRKEQALIGSEIVAAAGLPRAAADVTKGGALIFDETHVGHLEDVKAFCKTCARFKPKTWKDAFPLTDLLRALLLYLLQQMQAGQQLAEEQAEKRMQAAIELEKAKMASELQMKLMAARREATEEADKKLQKALETMRQTVGEEYQSMIRMDRDEKERATTRAAQAEAALKKVKDRVEQVQGAIEAKDLELKTERAAAAAALAKKDADIEELQTKVGVLERTLATARTSIVEALKASTKKELVAAAANAIGNAIPGAVGYVAELRTIHTADKDSAAELAELLPPPGAVQDPLAASISPGFLFSPWAASRPGTTSSSKVGGDNEGSEVDVEDDIKKELVFKYVQASQGHEFMIGAKLPYGQGVSWGLVDGEREVRVEDVAFASNIHFFRNSQQTGSYVALPLVGRSNELIGMLCADTLEPKAKADASSLGLGGTTHAKQLTDSERTFVKQLGGVLSTAIGQDQEQLMAQMLQETVEAEPDPGPIDASDYADYDGGLRMFNDAINALNDLSSQQLEEFKNSVNPNDMTVSILRSVLSAAGERNVNDWNSLRPLVNKSLLSQLSAMNPKDAWAAWAGLCNTFKPVFGTEIYGGHERLETIWESEEEGKEGTGAATLALHPVAVALARWLVAIRKVSAAVELARIAEAKLAKANTALMKTFAGDGCAALVELKSYRVPPKNTLSVLQTALVLAGHSNDDVHNWGKMRMLTTHKIIKTLVHLKPRKVPASAGSALGKLVSRTNEEDVKKESLATLALFKWLTQFHQAYVSLTAPKLATLDS